MTGGRSFSWPLILITIGLVFLLVNFGLVPGVTAVQLLNLWPLLLILGGVDLAIGRRWPLAAIGIDVGVIALGLALVATQPSFAGGPVFSFGDKGEGERDVTVARESARSMSLELNGGAGRFRISGGSAALVEAHSANADLRLRRVEYDRAREGQQAEVRIDQSGTRHVSGAPIDVEARLASDIPTDLEVNGGAGEFVIDLSSVMVTNAELNVGAASLTLTLPKPTAAVSIEVNAGASNITIDVPEGVEARVTTNGALLSLRSTNARVTASGLSAETSGYSSATARVTVKVTAGATSITIR